MLEHTLLLLPACHNSPCLRVTAYAHTTQTNSLKLRLLACRSGTFWCTLRDLLLQRQPLQCARVL